MNNMEKNYQDPRAIMRNIMSLIHMIEEFEKANNGTWTTLGRLGSPPTVEGIIKRAKTLHEDARYLQGWLESMMTITMEPYQCIMDKLQVIQEKVKK